MLRGIVSFGLFYLMQNYIFQAFSQLYFTNKAPC
jgi:hypothetical protein